MHYGSCLCGGIRYELDAELTEIACCHCESCRKAQGSAFATNAPVPEAKFSLLSGHELLTHYESSPGKQRAFCSRCASPIYSRSEKLPGIIRLRIGALDTPVQRHPDYHIFAASVPSWDRIRDDAPQYPRWKE